MTFARKALFHVLLWILILGLTLALCEVAVRIWERRALSAKGPLERDPIDLAALKLNETNIRRKKARGEFRVLSFGDSFAYAIMRPDLTYAGIAATSLEEKVDDLRFRVVNLGEPATTTRHYVPAHKFWSRTLEHDGALFNIYMGNDILDVAYSYTPATWELNYKYKDQYHLEAGMKKSPVPRKFALRVFDYAYALYASKFRTQKNVPPDARFNRAATHNLPEELFLETNKTQLVNFDPASLDSLAEGYRSVAAFFRYVSAQRQSGLKVLVVMSPNQIHVEGPFRQRIATQWRLDLSRHDFTLPARVITAIRDRIDPRIELVDLSPYFVCAADRGMELYYLTNTHWGPEGNDLAGRIIANRIAESWFGRTGTPVDPRCDVALYYRRFAKVDQAAIEQFAERVARSN